MWFHWVILQNIKRSDHLNATKQFQATDKEEILSSWFHEASSILIKT